MGDCVESLAEVPAITRRRLGELARSPGSSRKELLSEGYETSSL